MAFPWMCCEKQVEHNGFPYDVPTDILLDTARVVALLDIRQMLGAKSELQDQLTELLMDYDLMRPAGSHNSRQNCLFPDAESPLWLHFLRDAPPSLHQSIASRIKQMPNDCYSHQLSWVGDSHIIVGHHKLPCRPLDIQALQTRWDSPDEDAKQHLEMARLLALYGALDNPLSHRHSGTQLCLDPGLRYNCDYELFASPLNAVVPNGCFASKWPNIEWRFGSMGSYPHVIPDIPVGSIVCVNPPFTNMYLSDVAEHLPELKERFRLRCSVPVREAPWRQTLHDMLPSAQVLRSYYDASSGSCYDLLNPTLLWEDPRCRVPEPFGRQDFINHYAKAKRARNLVESLKLSGASMAPLSTAGVTSKPSTVPSSARSTAEGTNPRGNTTGSTTSSVASLPAPPLESPELHPLWQCEGGGGGYGIERPCHLEPETTCQNDLQLEDCPDWGGRRTPELTSSSSPPPSTRPRPRSYLDVVVNGNTF